MKKLLLILFVSTIFLGCSKDDDNPFIGKWLVSTEDDRVWGYGYEFYEKGKCIYFYEQRGEDDIREEYTYTIEDTILIIKGEDESKFTFSIIDKNRIHLKRKPGDEFNLLRYEEWRRLYSKSQ